MTSYIKPVGLDYIGYQLGNSLVQMKLSYKSDALKVIIGSSIYRIGLKEMLPKSVTDLFAGLKDDYIRNIVIDGIMLSLINILFINVIGKREGVSKTMLKSFVQALFTDYVGGYSCSKK